MGGEHIICCGLSQDKKAEEEQFLSLFELGHPSPLAFRLGAPGSWAVGLGLNYTTGFPGSLAGREQTVRLLTFHNQFL